jgi:DNA-binding NarL/FixJ family response regulator
VAADSRLAAAGLIAVAEDLAGEFSLRPLLERILLRCTELLGCSAGSICSVDEAAGTYRKEADIGVACQSGQVFPLTEGMTGVVVTRRAPVWFERYEEVRGGHVAAEDRATLRGVIGVPLEWRGRVIGACVVFSRDERRVFGPADAELLALFARHAAIALGTARMHQAAEERVRAEAAASERDRLLGEVQGSLARRLVSIRAHLDAAERELGEAGIRDAAFGSAPAGSAPAGHETAGHETAGHETAGHETAGHETAGHETASHAAAARLRVLVAAGRPLLRAGLVHLLTMTEPGIAVVGEAATVAEAMAACGELRPDVVLADVRLARAPALGASRPIGAGEIGDGRAGDGPIGDGPAGDGSADTGIIAGLLDRWPGLPVVGVCEAGDERLVAAAMTAGASGCVDTAADGPELARAVLAAGRGQAFLSGPVLARLQRGLRDGARGPALTERERQVRVLMERGLPDKAIAELLVLSVKTVEKHAGAVLRKTGARNRTELAALAAHALP